MDSLTSYLWREFRRLYIQVYKEPPTGKVDYVRFEYIKELLYDEVDANLKKHFPSMKKKSL